MEIDFFSKLSNKEAKLFLTNYLSEAKIGFEELIPLLENDGIVIDFSLQSLKEVLLWIITNLKTIPKLKDETLPSWIIESESYKIGLYGYDSTSEILILRTSYYFGECFIQKSSKLSWNIGNKNTIEENMPVIKGFVKKMELAPFMVCKNLIERIIEGSSISTFDIAVKTWLNFIPE